MYKHLDVPGFGYRIATLSDSEQTESKYVTVSIFREQTALQA